MKRMMIALGAMSALLAVPASAKDGVDAWVELEARAVQSDRTIIDGDDIESSGAGVSVDVAFQWTNGRTEVQFDLGAEVFDFSEETRNTRESGSASVMVSQGINDNLSVAVNAGHWEDIVTLEARQTDQDAIRGEVQYEDKVHRVRLRAQYREREYESVTPSTGNGMRYDAQYNYRFASWHWARVELRAEDINSDHPRRGYERYMVRASYSLPLDSGKNWRLRPQLEYRDWTYDERWVLDDPAGELRHDSYIQPEIGLAYGKSNGLKARLRAAYQFRSSNDPQYTEDAPYFDLRVAYRF